MDELFKKLFESEVLTDESKTELKEAFNTALTEAIDAAVEKTTIETKAALVEEYLADKEALIEALDTKTETYLASQLEELQEDILRFRDLEVEYAGKIVEAKAEMAQVIKGDMGQLLEDLDAFFEVRLAEEFAELKDDLEIAKKNAVGQHMFEGFMKEYNKNFRETDDTSIQLDEARETLDKTELALKEAKAELNAIRRSDKMDTVLESLSGKSREVMAAILKTVPTNKLDETYAAYIGRVLHESVEKVEENSEKESVQTSVLAEKDTSAEKVAPALKVITGNESLNENSKDDESAKISEATRERLQVLAGLRD